MTIRIPVDGSSKRQFKNEGQKPSWSVLAAQIELLEIQVCCQAGLWSGSGSAIITGLCLEEFGEIGLGIVESGVKSNAGLRTDNGVIHVSHHAGLDGRHFGMF